MLAGVLAAIVESRGVLYAATGASEIAFPEKGAGGQRVYGVIDVGAAADELLDFGAERLEGLGRKLHHAVGLAASDFGTDSMGVV